MKKLLPILTLLFAFVSCDSTITTQSICEGNEANITDFEGVYSLNFYGQPGTIEIIKEDGLGEYTFLFEVGGETDDPAPLTMCKIGNNIYGESFEDDEYEVLRLNQINTLTYSLAPLMLDKVVLDSMGVSYDSISGDMGEEVLTIHNENIDAATLLGAEIINTEAMTIQFTKL